MKKLFTVMLIALSTMLFSQEYQDIKYNGKVFTKLILFDGDSLILYHPGNYLNDGGTTYVSLRGVPKRSFQEKEVFVLQNTAGATVFIITLEDGVQHFLTLSNTSINKKKDIIDILKSKGYIKSIPYQYK